MPVLRRQISCAFETLRSQIEISLTQCQYTPVGPAGGFRRGNPRHDGKARVGTIIISDLQGSQAGVEGPNDPLVLTGGWIR